MWSFTLQAGSDEVVTFDAFVGGAPTVAEIALNHFNRVDGTGAWISSVDDFFLDGIVDPVYVKAQQVTFVLVGGFTLSEGVGDTFSTARADIFRFSQDSTLLPTPLS